MRHPFAAVLVLVWGGARAAVPVPAEPPERVAGASLADLFWTAVADCDARADDLLRRQCRGVRADRLRANGGRVFVAEVDAGALWIGAPDPARGGVPVRLRGCLACAHPVRVGGEERAVVTRGSVRVEGGEVVGPDLYAGVLPDAEARRARHLRAQVAFRVPAGGAEAWTQLDRRGFFVEPVGFRVWDECDGTILAGDPPPALGERGLVSHCAGDGAAPTTLPEQPSTDQVKEAMSPVGARANECFESFGVPGTADLWLIVGGDGVVRNAEVRGELADSPTAKCIQDAARKARFPRFSRPTMQIHYPFILR